MTRADLDRIVTEAPEEELPSLVGDLSRAHALAFARLVTPKATSATDDDELLTMADVAKALDIGEWNARELGRQGVIPTVHVGERGVRVRRGALRDYIRRNERGATMSRSRRA